MQKFQANAINKLKTLAIICGTTMVASGFLLAQKPIVKTEQGVIIGATAKNPGVNAFLGIPYAAPPVGELRWKEPQPARGWNQPLLADKLPASCMQVQVEGAGKGADGLPTPWTKEFRTQGNVSEDCLYLNIWVPARAKQNSLPVMVWFHGGGFREGSASIATYIGDNLAAKGAVVVGINYRLGVFGFLAHPELSAESAHKASGNYGTLDQIAALQWIHKNIAAFGGDPARVTLFGQSAGAGSVNILSVSPLASGLFHRAIAESGSYDTGDPTFSSGPMSYKKLEQAEQDGLAYAKLSGFTSVKDLRSLDAERLLRLPMPKSAPREPFFRPTLDGWVLPMRYLDLYAAGKQSTINFITGSNADENGASPQPNTTVAEFQSWAKNTFHDRADEFLKLYPAHTDEEANLAQNQAARDLRRTSLYLWALSYRKSSAQSLYVYYWNHVLPGESSARFGAFHTSEVPYVFSSLSSMDRPYARKDMELADLLSSYWVNFAATGNPNGKGLPLWPEIQPGKQEVFQIGDGTQAIPVASPERFEFLKNVFESSRSW